MHEAVAEDDRTQRDMLRRTLREKRAVLAEGIVRAMSADVCATIAAMREFALAHRVALYAPVRGEIDPSQLRDLLHERGAEVAYPRVVSTVPPLLAFCRVAPGEPLTPGRLGIPEPRAAGAIADGDLELIFVPGIAFARDGHRLGFGHGYYDRALAAAPRAVRIGLCHEFQLVDHLPPRPGDEPVDLIVTPRERLTTGARPLAPQEVPS
ncbi:MAG: 5-formyltetrahydrofolate cyclo-ligase [bacterium]|nr:5-formyltetrahydrofolate cyclo-ligase [bacterium]